MGGPARQIELGFFEQEPCSCCLLAADVVAVSLFVIHVGDGGGGCGGGGAVTAVLSLLSLQVFSRTPLSNETLDLLFEDVAYRANVPWEAYPKLDPMRTFPPVVLAEHLYYANSFEFVVSTMETETIAARNVVNLLREDFGIPKPAGTETSDMPQDEL